MMHRLRRYDAFASQIWCCSTAFRNDAMFAQCAVRHTSLGVAVIIGRSPTSFAKGKHHWKKPFALGSYPKGQFSKYGISKKRYTVFCVCVYKCSACQENWQVIDEHKKAPLCKGSWRLRRLRDCLFLESNIYNPSVTACRATSLYTREAFFYLPEGNFTKLTKYIYISRNLWYNNYAKRT